MDKIELLVKKIVNEITRFLRGLVNVKNVHHGTDEDSKYLKSWEKITNRKAKYCANYSCKNRNASPKLVGAHVKKVWVKDNSWYIIPLCHMCNSDENNDMMLVREKDLVPYHDVAEIESSLGSEAI